MGSVGSVGSVGKKYNQICWSIFQSFCCIPSIPLGTLYHKYLIVDYLHFQDVTNSFKLYILTGLTQLLRQDAICRVQMPFAPTRYGGSA
ncbi:MAG: hypothetical protein F6K40_22490 [Okeania sp. SIO3I5]|uniref:hypothetical protein n=1 Tax=Okeania sp. SIO3I5 TaxID=2607805 RepID=UPI0013BC3FBA|nr:hypothetical protein [Okeania sp. SIO3I5]NEQ38888.1 hypothetical protein [Okeania sp. SIO3I5]